MAQQPLWKAGDECVGSNRLPLSLAQLAVSELVEARRSGAVAGEVECQEPKQPGVIADFLAGEVELLGNRLARWQAEWARPVLADEGPLVRALARIAGIETGSMRRGEEQGR